MAGKPRLLSSEDAQFLTDVPRSLRISYPGHKPCDEISADFQVSVETARLALQKRFSNFPQGTIRTNSNCAMRSSRQRIWKNSKED